MKNISIILLTLAAILPNLVTAPPAEPVKPWLTIERQRSTDPAYDGMYFELTGATLDGKPARFFVETKDLSEAFRAKTPLEFRDVPEGG